MLSTDLEVLDFAVGPCLISYNFEQEKYLSLLSLLSLVFNLFSIHFQFCIDTSIIITGKSRSGANFGVGIPPNCFSGLGLPHSCALVGRDRRRLCAVWVTNLRACETGGWSDVVQPGGWCVRARVCLQLCCWSASWDCLPSAFQFMKCPSWTPFGRTF